MIFKYIYIIKSDDISKPITSVVIFLRTISTIDNISRQYNMDFVKSSVAYLY